MSMDNTLDNLIRRLRRRVRLLMVERYALFGGSVGAVTCAVIVLLSGRLPAILSYELWAGVVAAGVLGGVAFGLFRRLDDLSVAIAADRRTRSKERLSTAVSFPEADELEDMERAVISDAGGHFAPLKAAEVFRHRFGLPHTAFGVSACLLLGVILLPHLSIFQSRERRQEVIVMKTEGAKIIRIAKEIEKKSPRDEKELKKLATRMEKLGQQMQSGRMPKKQAMLKTRHLSKDIKEAQDRLARNNSTGKSMDQARAQTQEATSGLAREAAEKIAKQEGIPLDEAMKRLPTDKRLAELARKSGTLSKAEAEELEKLISKYADPNGSMPIPPELGEALAKLMQNEDYLKAMELMRQIALKLNLGKGSKMDQELMKKQLEALAKALQNTDLDELARQMRENAEKLAQMSPEELQKLLEQIRKAQMLAKAGGG